jgi:hypothetical protein
MEVCLSLAIAATLSSACQSPLAPARVIACRPGLMRSLVDLLSVPQVAVGRVERIHRSAHSPFQSRGSLQHTVFAFRVEKWIKNDLRLQTPLVKVRQEMGDLPWQDGAKAGVGFRIVGEPMLIPGNRYLLFLLRNGDPDRSKFRFAEFGGVRGVDGETDELSIHGGEFGQILIRDGKLTFPQVSGEPYRPDWRFEKGPQLLGLREKQAMAVLSEALRERRRRDAEEEARIKEAMEDARRQVEAMKKGTAKPPPTRS